jgi:hypothetical protein
MKTMRPYLVKIIIPIALLFSAQSYGFDAISVDEQTSLFKAIDKSVPVVTAKYIGWGANWKWGSAKIKPDTTAGQDKSSNTTTYAGSISVLDIDFSSTIKQNNNNQIVWTYNWNKKTDIPDAIGFGINFNLKLDSASFEGRAKDPELLPGNQGWRWQTPDGQSMEVKFSPALAALHFERKQANNIRAMFFTSITQGPQQTTMTVTVSGKNSHISNPAVNNYDPDNINNWHKDILSDSASPVDLSFLNAQDLPAGKHGFVKAQADKMIFADGTPAKFWGTNLMAYALFDTPDDEIKIHAKRIAQLGFNLVRIHHHDSKWVKSNIFKNPADNTQELSDNAFKKLDLWIKCLKDEGVYIWLDLHVGRTFTQNDNINNFDDLAKDKNKGVKGFSYYNESIQKQMQRFNEAYLNHVNPLTTLAYKNDPAIIALLITNENDLTQHFGNQFLPVKGFSGHSPLFTSDAKLFSKANGLSEHKAMQTWSMGESKIYLGNVEHRFNQKMIAHLRNLGAKSMFATTNSWGGMGLSGLPSLTDGDLIDIHSYGKAEEMSYNPRYNPGFLTWIGAGQVTAKPLSITEWNSPTAIDRFTVPLYTASIANLQGWDAMMLYGYSVGKMDRKAARANTWSSYLDPAMIGLMPAAALLYRQNHVAPAKQNFELKLNREDFFFKKQDPSTSKTIRTLLETSRFSVTVPETKELPWLKATKPASATSIVTDANKDFIPVGQTYVLSDTGELKRDWERGIHTVDTAKSQIAAGWIGGKTIKLQDISFEIQTKKAVLAVQSLENKPIAKSKLIFITAMARSKPGNGNKLPFLSEPVIGDIVISAPSGLKFFPINRLGEKQEPIKISYVQGKYRIKLNDKNEAHWFLLSAN